MSLMPKGMAKQHAREPGQPSIRNKTVAMVEGHLNKQRSAYDHWIAELCRDAEESAMERDRLKAKLAALRDDHKRKVMTKIIGRCDLGVLKCCGAFTSLIRLVSTRRGRGWFLF